MDSAASRYREGDIFAEKYRIERVLGVGGMGVVLAATHIELGERRAIKLMHTAGSEDSEYVVRFLREARALARLRGEHIARVHDVGRLGDGAPYMVIEYLEGTDLAAVLEARSRLSLEEAVLFGLQVCEALAEAHAMGIVHRDLKPQNLFLTRAPDGSPHVKVIDFGIAKTTAIDATQPKGASLGTKTGAWMGSPLYMSPEQIQSARDVDARSDIWSLGAILYELLTGKHVWPGNELMEIFYQVTMTAPIPPSSVVTNIPPGIEAVVLRCLEKDRARRWASVAELAEALEPFASAEGKTFARRAMRILWGRQSTEPHLAQALGPQHPSVVPTLAASAPAAQTPIPLANLSQAAIHGVSAVPPTNSAPSSPRVPLVFAVLSIAIVSLGIAAYVVRGNAEEPIAPVANAHSASTTAELTAPSASAAAMVEPPIIFVAPASPDPSSDMDRPKTPAPSNTANNPIRRPATTVAKPLPDKPRPGVIPR